MANNNQMDPNLLDALDETGFVICKFGPTSHDTCDRCKEPNKQLYFGNRCSFDSREGDYWCEDCVIYLAKINQDYENDWID